MLQTEELTRQGYKQDNLSSPWPQFFGLVGIFGSDVRSECPDPTWETFYLSLLVARIDLIIALRNPFIFG